MENALTKLSATKTKFSIITLTMAFTFSSFDEYRDYMKHTEIEMVFIMSSTFINWLYTTFSRRYILTTN